MLLIYVIVEGQAEETFVKHQLVEMFIHRDIHLIPIVVYKPGQRGGLTSFSRAKNDILATLKQKKNPFCTTMFDFFRLPKDFPGKDSSTSPDIFQKVKVIEDALNVSISESMGVNFHRQRFIPYIQLHEFEALLFSDTSTLAGSLGRSDSEGTLSDIRSSFESPEHINDGPETAPSKRLLLIMPGYSKPIDGLKACKAIGIPKMRSQCKHFNSWIEKLENLSDH
jgi:Domain of unknown function (DUF4276)